MEVKISQLGGEPSGYFLQLPPEYDPYRTYPCIVALNSEGSSEESELSWWVGDYNETYQRTMGEASRHGYVVIAPRWRRPDQLEYEFTENEHARVLACLRDAESSREHRFQSCIYWWPLRRGGTQQHGI